MPLVVRVSNNDSSLLTGQRGNSGAAGTAVPSHHLQHCPAGLQEDLGESLPDGLDPQHVRSHLLTLFPCPGLLGPFSRAEKWGAGTGVFRKGFNRHLSVSVPKCSIYVLFAFCLAKVRCYFPQVSWLVFPQTEDYENHNLFGLFFFFQFKSSFLLNRTLWNLKSENWVYNLELLSSDAAQLAFS